MKRKTLIINSHWDKILRKNKLSDKQIEVVKKLLFDNQMAYTRIQSDLMNEKRKKTFIITQLKGIIENVEKIPLL
jgi:hypothetical protein